MFLFEGGSSWQRTGVICLLNIESVQMHNFAVQMHWILKSDLSLDRIGSFNSYEVPEEKEIHISEVFLPFVPYESSDDDISMRSVALHKTSANHTHQTSQTVSTQPPNHHLKNQSKCLL